MSIEDFKRCKATTCIRKENCRHYTITLSPLENIVLNMKFIREEKCVRNHYSEFVATLR